MITSKGIPLKYTFEKSITKKGFKGFPLKKILFIYNILIK